MKNLFKQNDKKKDRVNQNKIDLQNLSRSRPFLNLFDPLTIHIKCNFKKILNNKHLFNYGICLMVMIKLVLKEGVKNVKNDFMFMKLANIVLSVQGKYKNDFL